MSYQLSGRTSAGSVVSSMRSAPIRKDVEVQTMYRESEAQTEPYSPDYFATAEHEPEIVHLARMGLHYSNTS